jgi:hypothetical protein
MVMEVSIFKNISHLDKEIPWLMCYYCCTWVLHIWLKALHILNWLSLGRKESFFFLGISLDGHKIIAWLF